MPVNDNQPDAGHVLHNTPSLTPPQGDFDELAANSPWDPGSPATDNSHPVDPYSPQMIGRVASAPSEDHNSSSIDTVYKGMGSDA